MFKNMTTKQRIFTNMLLAQIGFAAISITAITVASDSIAIVIVNIIFAVIVGYTNYASMKSLGKFQKNWLMSFMLSV